MRPEIASQETRSENYRFGKDEEVFRRLFEEYWRRIFYFFAHRGPAVEDRIERVYDELIALTREESAEAEEIERVYARLLELQTAEARQFRERFEASLNMPIDAGNQILARVRALREELEDLAPSDPAA